MGEVQDMKMRYFRPVAGRVCVRFGSNAYIGATRTDKGFIIDPEAVVPIPADEVRRYTKEYRNLLRERVPGHGPDLKEVDKPAYDAYLKRREQKRAEARAKREAGAAKAKAATDNDDSEPEGSDEGAE